jgi:hypothetical protein
VTGIGTQWLTPISPAVSETGVLHGKSKIMPPVLVNVVGKYNIVRYKSQYFAIPHGQSVDWDKDDVSKFPAVLTAYHLNELNKMLPL